MKNLFRLFVLTAVLCSAVWGVSAQDNIKISIQGTLKDANSAAVDDGDYNATFRLYKTSSGGDAIWEETATVRVTGGVYSYPLGSTVALNGSDFDSTLFVGVTVNGIDILPRTELTYAPYTLHTPFATKAGNGVYPGTMLPFAGPLSKIPVGYLPCNGQAYSSAEYPELFAAIGTAWGDGSENQPASGPSDFNVPSTGGLFLRGWGAGSGSQDPDRNTRTEVLAGGAIGNNVGSLQGDAIKEHNHTISASGNTNNAGSHSHSIPGDSGSDSDLAPYARTDQGPQYISIPTSTAGNHSHSFSVSGNTANQAGGGTETRSKNISVLFIIKY